MPELAAAGLLAPAELMRAAIERAGSSDFGGQAFEPALHRLTTALAEQANLNEAGRGQVNAKLLGRLVNRLRLRQQATAHPEIAGLPIERPVFIVGLHRTGSTFAHALLSQHPELSGPVAWELMFPVTPPGHTEAELIEQSQAAFDGLFADYPAFRSIHDMYASMPDECRWLMGNEFQDITESTIEYRIPDYTRWLMAADLTDAYRGHRRQLQHILWRRPRTGSLLLKNPGHLWHLPEISKVYPDARLIVLHREPVSAIASACSLSLSSRLMTSDRVDRSEIGRERVELTVGALRALLDFRDRPLGGSQILDLRYADLLADPTGAAATVFEFLELPVTPSVRAAVRDHVRANPQHQHGRHAYAPEEFGVRADAITDEFVPYRERFLGGR